MQSYGTWVLLSGVVACQPVIKICALFGKNKILLYSRLAYYRKNSMSLSWECTILVEAWDPRPTELTSSNVSVVMRGLTGWWRAEHNPRRNMMADRRREKISLHLIQFIVLLVGLLCFSAIIAVILLYTMVAVSPMPPDVDKTSEEKDPCSISLTCSSYCLLFSIFFQL